MCVRNRVVGKITKEEEEEEAHKEGAL